MRGKTMNIMTSLAKRASIVAIAAVLATVAIAGTAYAYFTAYTQANGGHTLELGYSTEITEDVTDGVKTISMKNTGDIDVKVRIQIFYGSGINNSIAVVIPDADGWTKTGDNMWEYDGVLAPDANTSDLKVEVRVADGVDDPSSVDLSNFDVIVIGQTSPVYYDDNGNPIAYLWSGDQQANES